MSSFFRWSSQLRSQWLQTHLQKNSNFHSWSDSTVNALTEDFLGKIRIWLQSDTNKDKIRLDGLFTLRLHSLFDDFISSKEFEVGYTFAFKRSLKMVSKK